LVLIRPVWCFRNRHPHHICHLILGKIGQSLARLDNTVELLSFPSPQFHKIIFRQWQPPRHSTANAIDRDAR
jgi:hypothetical protein